jgi:hypothetical protein
MTVTAVSPTPERDASRDGVVAPTLVLSRRDVLDRAARRDATPARRDDATPDRREARRVATRRRVTSVRTAIRAVPGRSLQTITATRQIRQLGVRPTDTLLVWRIRRFARWCDSPVAVVVVTLIAVAVGAVWFLRPGWVEPVTVAAFSAVCVLAGWAGWGIADGVALWPHRARWVNELGYALRRVIDIAPDMPAAKFVRWAPDFGEAGTEMRIILPRGFVGYGDERSNILAAVHEVGGFSVGDLAHKFVVTGPFSYVKFTPRERVVIPRRVRADAPEVIELLDRARPGRPLLAIAGAGSQILGDLAGEAPHMGFSMRTGGGKSNQLKSVIAQEMHHGASVVILDLKRRSLKCFKGLEGVLYLREVDQIHAALIKLYAEADHRNRLADELGPDEEPPWQRRLIVMEEQNSTIDELVDYWLQVREPGDPNVSPAVRAYRKLLNMGRGVDMNVLAVFQKLTAQAAGGTTARDNFGMVVVSKPKQSLWRMVADDIPFPNVSGKPPGRSWYICDGEAPEGQALLWTDKFAREWASSGVSSAVRAYDPSRGSHNSRHQGKRPANVAGTPVLEVGEVPDVERLYTVREASRDKGVGIVDMTYQSLRGARPNDPEFPDPDHVDGQKKLYRAETLRAWFANREGA